MGHSFFEYPNLTPWHGLGISCIMGAIGYATDSRIAYRCIAEWVERLCKGDGDATLATLIFLSLVFGSSPP